MTRRVVIRWGDDRLPGRLARPRGGGAATGVLLAHGAGAGQDHPFMTAVRDGLAGRGLVVLTFDYPYMAAGRRGPDPPGRLLSAHAAAASRLAREVDRVVVAGKSMGGRMASHLVGGYDGPRGVWHDRFTAAGIVVFGYPLVAAGKSEPRDVAHLRRLGAPLLLWAGDRDPLCPLPLLRKATSSVPDLTIEIVDGADHSFRVPGRSGRSNEDVIESMTEATARWIERLA